MKNTAKDSYGTLYLFHPSTDLTLQSPFITFFFFVGVLTPPNDSTCLPQSQASNVFLPLHHRTVIFWFFTQIPHPTLDAIACTPTISLWNVTADVDLYTKKLTQVQAVEVLMLPSTSEFPRASSISIPTNQNVHINSTGNPILDHSLTNISGYPMYGRAHNGLFFDWNITDSLVLERLEGLQMVLPATMYRAAKLGLGGLEGAFRDGFEGYAERVYVSSVSLSLSLSIYWTLSVDVFPTMLGHVSLHHGPFPLLPPLLLPSNRLLHPSTPPNPNPNPTLDHPPPPPYPPNPLAPPRHPPHPHLPALPPALPALPPAPNATRHRRTPRHPGVVSESGDGRAVDGIFGE